MKDSLLVSLSSNKPVGMLRIARRGAWGYAPENTLAAFHKATEIPCDVVEFDVHRTRDGHVVVMHDHTVRRTTDGTGKIHDFDLKHLRRLHEKNGEAVPLLEDVVRILKGKRKLLVDIKDSDMEKLVLDILRVEGAMSEAIIDSDHTEVIEATRELSDDVRLFLGGVTKDNFREIIERAKHLKADMIKVRNSYVTPGLVAHAHKHGVGVYVWGAEQPDDIQAMVEQGVDALVCMFPDRIPV